MAINVFADVTKRGTQARFMNELATFPAVFDKHTQKIPSDAADEEHVWLGMVPEPRILLSGRNFVGISDFAFVLTNNTYELSIIISRESTEDDRHGLVNRRVNDMASIWATFMDSLFAAQLIAAESDTAFDGTSYYSASRTIGDSGTIDNTSTANIDPPNSPSLEEMQTALKEMIENMWRFEDSTGRTAYNTKAMSQLRLIIPPEYHRIVTEVVNSDLVGGGGGNASDIVSTSNPFFKNIVEIDVLPYLTDADDAIYLDAVGDPDRMPFLHQERTSLEVAVFNSENEIAENDGLKILARQRFRLGLGEPRRSFRYDFT